MQIFHNKLSIKFTQYTFMTSMLSSLLIVSTLIILIIKGFNLSIEFTGGTNISISIPNTPINEFREIIHNQFEHKIEIVEMNTDELNTIFILRMKYIDNETSITDKLKSIYPTMKIISIDSFGPKLGNELMSNAQKAILCALLLISLYIAIRFDRYYALGSLAALIHDVTITVGILSMLNIEIGISIIAALLTIVGYSLNDTIVIFDRIRENMSKLLDQNKSAIVNRSLNETLNRTAITSITTFLVVFVLFLFGGAVLKSFALTLIIGIFIGTYSSIFVASPVMLYFETKYPIPEYIDEEV